MATSREVWRGVLAAVAALVAMAATAAAGLLLLDVGRIGGLTAGVVALSVGGSAELAAAPAGDLPFAVHGDLAVMPLGVSLVGAVVLGRLLLPRRDGLLVRGAAAAVAFPAGIAAVAAFAGGAVAMPGGAKGGGSGCGLPAAGPLGRGGSGDALGAGFSVAGWPTLAGAVAWALAVVGVCWLVARFRIAVRGVLWAVGGCAAGCLVAAGVLGGAPAAGGLLLVLPAVVFGAVSLGLGVPWSLSSQGTLSCVLDGVAPPAPGGPLTWVAVAALLGLGVVVGWTGGHDGRPVRRATRLAVRLGPVVGAVAGVLALLSGVSVEVGVDAFGFSLSLLDARLAADPLLASVLGTAGGAVAGFAGSLLVAGILRLASVSWPAWADRVGR